MFTTLMTAIILILGLATVILSCVTARFFYKHHVIRHSNSGSGRLANAIKWQLLGEAVIGFGTVIFAFAAHFGYLNDWSLMTQSTLRFIMFIATSVTTLHLLIVMMKLKDSD